MEAQLDYIPEPLLEFGYGQQAEDPKDGLFLFGPLKDRKPAEMRIGVVGTVAGLARYRDWVKSITSYLPTIDNAPHHKAFPGFESLFNTVWPINPVVEIPISASDISRSIRIDNRHVAIYETVSLFADPIRKKLREDDIEVDVWFVIIPEEIYLLGRPLSRVKREERVAIPQIIGQRAAKRLIREPSLFIEDMKEAEVYYYDLNFHHQLKARLVDTKAVVQIVRDTSLNTITSFRQNPKSRRLQEPATLAWNLCTTSFFKAGGRPWKLAKVRDGVCYIGLVFKKNTVDSADKNACCGAQMFLDSGDGLVFKGAMGPWYSSETKEFHLPSSEAKALIETVIASYKEIHGKPPSELFIHGKTRFSEAEWEGFKSGTPEETNLVGVRITRSQEMKLFRLGRTPLLRGTTYHFNHHRALLWTMGYIPHLKTYPGREVPNPLSIDICQGKADLKVVLKDIMGLTKVNFNACIFADGSPVTLRFANAVGEILTAAPQADGPPLPFRHYI